MSSERLVVTALLQCEDFAKRVIGHINPDYFELDSSRAVFNAVKSYIVKYQSLPNKLTVETIVGGDESLDVERTEQAQALIDECYGLEPPDNTDWAVDQTEVWCRDRALYLAINQSIAIYQGEDKKFQTSAIPELVRSALSVSFDRSLGMDFFEDTEKRWDYYTKPENKLTFRIDVLNEVTCGGVTRKSLNVLAAGINVGKSMCLTALAADYIKSGYNVLYVSLEMREELVLQRLDANLLDTPINSIKEMGKDRFVSRITALREKSYGRFKVKDWPPSSASALNIEALMDEYEMIDGFKPDIVMVDYIQICGSYRMKSDAGSYYYYKSVAEELRSIAVKRNIVMWTVSQFNRGGMGNTDPSMSDTGESMGIPATADGMWAVMRTDELDQVGQLAWKQLKSRYANKAVKTHFMTGVEVDKFQLFGIADHNDKSVRQAIKDDTGRSTKERFSKMKFNKEQSE